MNSFEKLAKEITSRTNTYQIGVCIGEVINIKPITMCIYCLGEGIIFDNFICSEGLLNGGTKITEGDLYVTSLSCKIGDKFICIMGNDNQGLYVIEKLESIKKLSILLKEDK